MSRSICLLLALTLGFLGTNSAFSQDAATSAASTPGTDDVTALKTENAALKKEVSDAKATIARLQAQIAQSGQPVASTDTTAPGATPAPATPAGPMKALPLDAPNPALEGTNAAPGAPAIDTTNAKTYTVVKGDSLWKIAHKMYPHDTKNGVDKLQEANKDAIGGKPLKIGQVLVVPQ